MQRYKLIINKNSDQFEKLVDKFLQKIRPEDVLSKTFETNPTYMILHIIYWERSSIENILRSDTETI